MKKNEVKVGGRYVAKVSGKLTIVRVDSIRIREGWNTLSRDVTVYDVTNEATGRTMTFSSAAKFRGPAKDAPAGKAV